MMDVITIVPVTVGVIATVISSSLFVFERMLKIKVARRLLKKTRNNTDVYDEMSLHTPSINE